MGEIQLAQPAVATWRRWSHPRQKLLMLLAVGVMVASFMPWLQTPVGIYSGFAGPGRWLFYAGFIGLGAGLVPIRALAILQGGILAATAILLPLSQVVKMFRLVRFDGWFPGTGMILIFGSGLIAAFITAEFVRNAEA